MHSHSTLSFDYILLMQLRFHSLQENLVSATCINPKFFCFSLKILVLKGRYSNFLEHMLVTVHAVRIHIIA